MPSGNKPSLCQCLPRPMSHYGVTGPQWFIFTCITLTALMCHWLYEGFEPKSKYPGHGQVNTPRRILWIVITYPFPKAETIITILRPDQMTNILKTTLSSVFSWKKVSFVFPMIQFCPASFVPPSHYLNQCYDIVKCTLGNKLQWNFNR